MKKLVALGVIAVLVGLASPAYAQYQGQNFVACTPATANPGSNVACEAGYFQPGSTVTWTLFSTPVNLGTSVADSNGIARISFTMPTGMSLGAHTVQATGTSFDGVGQTALTVTAGITLGNAVSQTAPTGNLPVTGSDTGYMTTIAVALVAGGALLVLATRRKSSKKDLVDA